MKCSRLSFAVFHFYITLLEGQTNTQELKLYHRHLSVNTSQFQLFLIKAETKLGGRREKVTKYFPVLKLNPRTVLEKTYAKITGVLINMGNTPAK